MLNTRKILNLDHYETVQVSIQRVVYKLSTMVTNDGHVRLKYTSKEEF